MQAKRRDFFKALAGIGAGASALAMSAAPVRHKHGLLTVASEKAHRHLTGEWLCVSVDGVNVTKDCYGASDVEGYALVFCRDRENHRDWVAKGSRHMGGDGGVCQFRLTGDVVIAPGEPS